MNFLSITLDDVIIQFRIIRVLIVRRVDIDFVLVYFFSFGPSLAALALLALILTSNFLFLVIHKVLSIRRLILIFVAVGVHLSIQFLFQINIIVDSLDCVYVKFQNLVIVDFIE